MLFPSQLDTSEHRLYMAAFMSVVAVTLILITLYNVYVLQNDVFLNDLAVRHRLGKLEDKYADFVPGKVNGERADPAQVPLDLDEPRQ